MKFVITPVRATGDGEYQAEGEVERVFDTNAAGDLLPVSFSRIDGRTFRLKNPPFSQVYAEVATAAYD